MVKLLDKVASYINLHRLMQVDKLYLVALSGGRDSVALLLILRELGYHIEAVHCNFMLRGEESMRDERFCRDLCKRLDIPFHTIHFDTRSYASLHKLSIEMAARDLRYAHFDSLCRDIHADGVCVAHHMDDSVETIFLNLLRGTGIHGLTGISPRRDNIIRPLLDVRRNELEAYLAFHNQDYVDDSTNFVPDVNRNRLRLSVFPLLQEINPAFVENISRCANYLHEVEDIYNRAVDHDIAEAMVKIDDDAELRIIKQRVHHESVLFKAFSPYGFNPQQVNEIYRIIVNDSFSSGRRFLSPLYELSIERETLEVFRRDREAFEPLKIPEQGTYIISNGHRLRLASRIESTESRWKKMPTSVSVDAEKLSFPLTLRPVVQGDRFHPLGMKGSKLLSDFMTDQKMSYREKSKQLVLTNADGTIIWVVGRRIDHRFRITPSTTQVMDLEWLIPE